MFDYLLCLAINQFPNITGGNSTKDYFLAAPDDAAAGAINIIQESSGFNSYNQGGVARKGLIDASNSNSIYSNISTVQPKALTCIYLIKI